MTTVRGCEMFWGCFSSGCGICAVSPCSLSIDTTRTTTRISGRSISISGVTFLSGPRAPPPAIEKDIESSSLARACLQHQTPEVGREFPRTIQREHVDQNLTTGRFILAASKIEESLVAG